MTGARLSWQHLAIGVGYFALASMSILLTRFDNGLAYLWLAAPFLMTILLRIPRRRWFGPIACCAIGSMLATVLFGAGWVMAPFLCAANMAEALIAALALRRARNALLQLGSWRWFVNLFLCAGLLGPITMASIAMMPMWFSTATPPVVTLFRVMLGHGLSNLTFIPIFKLFASGGSVLWRNADEQFSWRTIPLFAAQAIVTIAVFAQQSLPLLFIPILPVVALAFGGNSRRTAVSLMVLALISGGMTVDGYGPVHLTGTTRGYEMQFLQFYLLVTVLTIIPIVSSLRSRSRLSARVRDSEARYRMLANHSSDIITHSDLSGRILFVSAAMERVAGYRPNDLLGSNLLELIDARDHAMIEQHYGWAIVHPDEEARFEYRGRMASGEYRWFESVCRAVRGPSGRSESIVSIVRDISDRKSREEELTVAATTDALTGLANRRAFRDRARAMQKDLRLSEAALALIDIDHFKSVNDRFGHDAGDEVLRTFGTIARQMLRHGDVLARVGGEEFAILFPGLGDIAAADVCDRIRAQIAATTCMTSAGPVKITISGGVTTLGRDNLDQALKRADGALYTAKRKGRDRLSLAA